jgi:hypothetical protein
MNASCRPALRQLGTYRLVEYIELAELRGLAPAF